MSQRKHPVCFRACLALVWWRQSVLPDIYAYLLPVGNVQQGNTGM